MSDREKVIESLIKALTRVGCGDMDNVALSEVEEAIESAIALLQEQEPRLLGLEEVKAIALRGARRTLSTEVEPVWLEQNDGGLTRLDLVLISWWYMEGIDEDETEFEFIAKYFGTDLDDTLNYLDYGTRWRVWSSKPTIEQRKAVNWDA